MHTLLHPSAIHTARSPAALVSATQVLSKDSPEAAPTTPMPPHGLAARHTYCRTLYILRTACAHLSLLFSLTRSKKAVPHVAYNNWHLPRLSFASISVLNPPDWIASQSSCRFWSLLRRMFSSMVLALISLYMCTSRVWPMRWQRSCEHRANKIR